MTFLFTYAAKLVGEKFAKPLTWSVLVLLLIGGTFLLGRCTAGDDTDGAQIEQTTRSSDAIADAAQGAIEILDGRVATEDAIDQVVAQTVKDIDIAANPDAVRQAVLAGVCGTPEHRNDQACMPTAENGR